MNEIYTITVATMGGMGYRLEPIHRTVGWFKTFQQAVEAICENRGGMDDHLYDYAVIEVIPPGVYTRAKDIAWFKFENDKWESCQPPEWSNGTINWGMG